MRWLWVLMVIIAAQQTQAQTTTTTLPTCDPLLSPTITPRAGLTRPTPGQCYVTEAFNESIDRLDAILCGAGLTCDLGSASVNSPSDLSSSLCDNTNNILKKVNGAWVCAPDSGSGGGGDVLSVFGRTGVITKVDGDYNLADLGDVSGKKGSSGIVQMFGGGATNTNDCAKFDGSGNVISAGAACGGGGNVNGTAPTTINGVAVWNNTGGTGISNSACTIASGNLTCTGLLSTNLRVGNGATGSGQCLLSTNANGDGEWGSCPSGGAIAYDATNNGGNESTALTKIVCDGSGMACDEPTADVARIQLSRHGTSGTQVQMFSGSSATNDCAKFDADGNVVSTGGVCSTGSSGFNTADGTYTIGGATALWRWDDNHAMGPMTWGPLSNGLMNSPAYSTQFISTPQAQWGGIGTAYNAMLTKAGGIHGGLSFVFGPPFLPRDSYVALNEIYTPDPPNLRAYQVTTAGVTAAAQPDGSGAASGYPTTWEPRWPRKLNTYVYSDDLAETLVYEVTASVAPCASFSCRCYDSGPGSGTCCYTGATRFDFSTCTTPGTQCTTADGSCKYTPRVATHANATVVTDGTAVLTKISDTAYMKGSSAYSVNPDLSLMENRFEAQVRDNDSSPAFILGRNTNQVSGYDNATAQRRRDGTNEAPFWLVAMGDSRSGLAREIGYTMDSSAPVYQAQGQLKAPYPTVPPTVTLSGAAGITGTDFCFAYAWEDIKTGGRTTLSPYACASPTNQVVTVAVSGFTWPDDVRAIVFVGLDAIGWLRIGELANSSATLPSSAWLLCVGGTNAGKTCTSNADCSGGGTCSADAIYHEHEMGYAVNNSGNELFGIRSGDAYGPTWHENTTWYQDDPARPTTPNGFKYMLIACGCDASCSSCSQPDRRGLSCTTSSSAGNEPTWSNAMSIGATVCESNGSNSLKWKNIGPDNPTVLVSASNTTGRDILQFKEAYAQMSSNVWRTLGGFNYLGDLYLNNKTVGSWWLNPTVQLSGRGAAGGLVSFGAGGTNTLDLNLKRTATRTLALEGVGGMPTLQFGQSGNNPFLVVDNGGSAGARLQFGDGSGTADVDLYRQGINVLATHDSFLLESTGGTPVEIRFKGTSSGYSGFQAGAQGSGIYHYVWPTTLPASSCLKTGTSGSEGTLSWASCGTGGGSPGGSDTHVQFNDGGSAFGGDSDFTWNKTTNVLAVNGTIQTASLRVSGGAVDGYCLISNASGDGTWTSCPGGAGGGGWSQVTTGTETALNVRMRGTAVPPTLTLMASDVTGGLRIDAFGRLLQNQPPDLPRDTAVAQYDHFRSVPPNCRVYVVSSAGTTGATQPQAIPKQWVPQMSLTTNDRVYAECGGGPGAYNFWYKVTSGACTTGTTAPTWCTTLGCTTTSSDNGCTYIAENNSFGTVSDNTASLQDVAFEATRAWGNMVLGYDYLTRPNVMLGSGDNASGAFLIGSSYGMENYVGDPSRAGQYAFYVGAGDSRNDIPNVIVGEGGRAPAFAITGAKRYPMPTIPPTVTLGSGGSLSVTTLYCFKYAWQDKITGASTPMSPYKCVTTDASNRKATVSIPSAAWPTSAFYGPDPGVVGVIYAVANVPTALYFHHGELASSSESAVYDAVDEAEGERDSAPFRNTTGYRPYESRAGWGTNNFSTWPANASISVGTAIVPSNPWGVTPAVPFSYIVRGVGCDANCTNCSKGDASGTTSSAEPAWRTDAALFCGDAVAGLRVQYQRLGYYDIANIFTPGDGTTDMVRARPGYGGYEVLAREYQGRPQYVCNTVARPTCDVSTRGLVWHSCSSSGTADTQEVCEKLASDAYGWTTVEQGGGAAPRCFKSTIGESQLTSGSTTQDITLFTLPANSTMSGKVTAVTIKHSTAFTGGGLSSMTVSVGDASDPTYYASAFDIFQTAAAGLYLDSGPQYKSYSSTSRSIIAHFTASGAVNAATAGSVDIWTCYVALP